MPVTREALNNAIRSNDLETIGHLLKTGKIDLNVIDEMHDLPLVVAAACGHADVFVRLLKAGADISAASKTLKTMQFSAARRGDVAIMKELFSLGIDIDATERGWTMLMGASNAGKPAFIPT